jgi:penicillin-binding protein 1A
MKTIVQYIFFSCVLLLALSAGGAMYIFTHHTVNFERLSHYNPGNPSILLDDEGNEWGRFQLDRRELIPLSSMPQHLINAFIAAEDWQFFSHSGISWKGIIRSVVVNLMHGKKVQGASTITQQLVKLLFFDSKKTFKRKIKEQMYAILAEQQCTKEQILETYLNHVYFGFGMYGVEAASQRLWGKHAAQLSLDECATLAAIIRCPGQYSPITNPLSAQKRRNIILHSMQKLQFITPQECAHARAQSIAIKDFDRTVIAPHLKELIRMQLEEEIGKDILYTGGLIIQTTINRAIQQHAEKSFVDHMTELKKTLMPKIDGALITIDSKSGSIKAMVGGYSFTESKFNRAWQAKRQMGSVFKPIIYGAAIARGSRFTDIEIDEPITIEQHNALWQPNNYNNKFDGAMTLAYALVRSNNIVSVKTLLKTGMNPVISLAKACHIEERLKPYPSLALGCIDATLKEVCGMFNVFANHGVYVEPHAIKWVKDQWGSKIWKSQPCSERVLPAHVTGQVAKVLELGIKRWRKAYNQELIADDVICKTGTTNDFRTCWFAGATPELTTLIYVGCDDNRTMVDAYPIKTAFPIWLGLHSNLKPTGKKFIYDPSLKSVFINQWTGKITHATDPEGIEICI